MKIARKQWSVGAALLMLCSATPLVAQGAEQLVFSTPGAPMTLTGNSKAKTTGFGYWIWCAAEAAAPSKGGYQLDNACQGSVYFYALDHNASHVIGFSTEDPQHEGIYTMTVIQGTAAQLFSGTLHPDYSCQLTNTVPDAKGPNQTVVVDCTLGPSLGGGTGHAVVTNSVVNVTGGK